MSKTKTVSRKGDSQGFSNYAFISYAREDEKAAAWLQRKLEWFPFRKREIPEDKKPFHSRYIRPIWRDRRNLEVSRKDYWDSICHAIDSSKYLIVLCSPNAADPQRKVNREVSRFLRMPDEEGPEYPDSPKRDNVFEQVIPVVLAGSIKTATDQDGVPQGGENCLPEALEPLRNSKRNFPYMKPEKASEPRGNWDQGLVGIISYMLDLEKSSVKDFLEEEERRRRRLRLVIGGVIGVLLVSSLWAGIRSAANYRDKIREQASAALQRSEEYEAQGNHFPAALHAGLGLEFLGQGVPNHEGVPVLLKDVRDEHQDLARQLESQLAKCAVMARPVWQTPRRELIGGPDGSYFAGPDGSYLFSPGLYGKARFSPDGKHVYTIEGERITRWKIGPEMDSETVFVNDASVITFEVASDGKKLAVATKGFQIHFVDLKEPAPPITAVYPVPEYTSAYKAGADLLQFSPDGSLLAAASSLISTPNVALYDTETGRALSQLGVPTNQEKFSDCRVGSLQFSPEGQTLSAATFGQENVCTWDCSTYELIDPLWTGEAQVSRFLLRSEGESLVGALEDGSIVEQQLVSRSDPVYLGSHPDVRMMELDHTGRYLATASSNFSDDHVEAAGEIGIWDIVRKARIATIACGEWPIDSLDFAPDSMTLAVCLGQDMTQLWDISGYIPLREDDLNAYIDAFAVEDSGKSYVFVGQSKDSRDSVNSSSIVKKSILDGREESNSSLNTRGIFALSLSENGVAGVLHHEVGGELYSNIFSTLKLDSKSEITSRSLEKLGVDLEYVHQVSEWIVGMVGESSKHPGTLSVFSGTEKLQERSSVEIDGVECLVASPDGEIVYSGWDNRVRAWDVETLQLQFEIEVAEETWEAEIEAMDIDPDGKRLLVATREGELAIWNLGTRERETEFFLDKGLGQIGSFTDIAFAPDGKVIASSDEWGMVRFWSVGSGYLLSEVQLQYEMVGMGFIEDGSVLIVATDEGGISLLKVPRLDVNLDAYREDEWLIVDESGMEWRDRARALINLQTREKTYLTEAKEFEMTNLSRASHLSILVDSQLSETERTKRLVEWYLLCGNRRAAEIVVANLPEGALKDMLLDRIKSESATK